MNAITMREIEDAAEEEMRKRYKALGIKRDPPPARFGKGLSGVNQLKVDAFFRNWGRR